MALSQSQLTKLGERLRAGLVADDLRLLDDYRRSFAPASQAVVSLIREHTGLQPTQRSAKSTQAIVEKLRRQSFRLGQIQDIAGCRVVVKGLAEQEETVSQLLAVFPDGEVEDRRETPSHGYRAVHLVVRWAGQRVEIQVRTELQHLWATVSEKLADEHGNAIKYGGGNAQVRGFLDEMADSIDNVEQAEFCLLDEPAEAAHVQASREVLRDARQALTEILSEALLER